jgi:hypothetical protein
MTPSKSTPKRAYQQHGLYAVQKALAVMNDQEAWLTGLGEVGHELKAWRAAIIADLGGDENISAMERAVVELAVKTHLMLHSVDAFMLEQKSLVNKRKRALFPVVLQRTALANALSSYLGQLGLKRRARPTPTLQDYLAAKENKEPSMSSPDEASERFTESTNTQHKKERDAEAQ